MNNQELKNCPFCGGEAVLWSRHEHDYRIGCKEDCIPCTIGIYNEVEEDAIKAWNTRADEKKSVYDIKFPYSTKQIKDLAKRLNRQAQDLNAEYGVNNADILEASFILSQADEKRSRNPDHALNAKNITGKTLDFIKQYCDENHVSVSQGDIDVVLGGFEKYLKSNRNGDSRNERVYRKSDIPDDLLGKVLYYMNEYEAFENMQPAGQEAYAYNLIKLIVKSLNDADDIDVVSIPQTIDNKGERDD